MKEEFMGRLTSCEREAIIEAIIFVLKEENVKEIFLYGSRAVQNERGGDIDLMVETNLNLERLMNDKHKILAFIMHKIGEQKIDLFLVPKKLEELSERSLNFYEMIKLKRIPIWTI